MKSRSVLCMAFLLSAAVGQTWKTAVPGYRYQFPRDHFSHPDYQTEWWYYTGNLRSGDGHRFGFELTFFRSALKLPPSAQDLAVTWRPDQIYLAHLALSDLDGHEFYHQERINRAGPGIAGADSAHQRYWNGNWSVSWSGTDQQLQAVTDEAGLFFNLHPTKPLVINGQDGISVKGPRPGEASHYISFPRLQAGGRLEWRGKQFAVSGIAWMDHEFFTETSDGTLEGWDWFSIQLDNNQELMLYRLRRNSATLDRFSSGTYIDSQGNAHFLSASDFTLRPARAWHRYPMDWKINVPSLGLTLVEHTPLENQELVSGTGTTPSYWEGAVTYSGEMKRQPVKGVGYLEMTGYGQPVWLAAK
jgi:predicted secreted hydrolase